MAINDSEARKVVFWGTYDTSKPRVRLLIEGARRRGLATTECHADVWGTLADKSQVRGLRQRLRYLVAWLLAYPGLVWRYLRLPAHDVVVVPYLGQLDALVIWPWAKLRRVPVVLDLFLSLYDTVIVDRRMIGRRNPLAYLLYAWEWLACRAAGRLFLDTANHARYVEELFNLPSGSAGKVFVGAEELFYRSQAPDHGAAGDGAELTVLFYGQFIPLHGVETIVRAARLLEDAPLAVHWHLIGEGQESASIDALIEELRLESIERVAWLPYERLPEAIHSADVCLGVFGATGKAARVIPNKVFQVLACRRPLITADTPAVRELIEPGPYLRLVPAADPQALADAVRAIAELPRDQARIRASMELLPEVDAAAVGRELSAILDS